MPFHYVCSTCGSDVIKSHRVRSQEVFCSLTCKAVGLRRRVQKPIEERYGKPITEILTEMYFVQKLGIKKIAIELGISDRIVWVWFDTLGIQRRSRSEAVSLQWDNNPKRREEASRIGQVVGASNCKIFGPPSSSPKARQKISSAKSGTKNPMYNRLGSLHPNWKGGKVTYRGKGWRGIRLQAIRRDNNKCRRCGTTEGLTVHHITPYRETHDNSLDNLVTLCWDCHGMVEAGKATWCPLPELK